MITWLFGKKKSQAPLKDDDFVSLSSHELRAPLSIIKWYTEMLLDGDAGPLTEEQKKYLTVIETSNQRAIDLVRSLLNVSRLDLGTFCINPKESNIVDIVSQVITSSQPVSQKKNLTIVKNFDNTLPSIMLDEHIVSFIVKQLLSNAIAFSQERGKIIVDINLVPGGATVAGFLLPEKSILVIVTDFGIGIPDDDLGKIFTKMYKASNVADSTESGSGLGLYMVKKLVDFFQGGVWLTSSQNKGTSVYFAIPCKGMKAKEGKTTLD